MLYLAARSIRQERWFYVLHRIHTKYQVWDQVDGWSYYSTMGLFVICAHTTSCVGSLSPGESGKDLNFFLPRETLWKLRKTHPWKPFKNWTITRICLQQSRFLSLKTVKLQKVKGYKESDRKLLISWSSTAWPRQRANPELHRRHWWRQGLWSHRLYFLHHRAPLQIIVILHAHKDSSNDWQEEPDCKW